jgi:nicotinamidase/pyrazinamidase
MTKTQRRKVASFDVDAQKTFTPLCPNELPVPEGDQIVSELNANAKLADIRVGSRDAHPSNALWIAKSPDDILAPVEGENIDVQWPSHAMMGTKGFELLDGLPHPVTGYDFMVSKGLDIDCHPYGACYHDLGDTKTTGVIEYLKANDVTTVIVGGLALEFCVAKTVTQLCDAGFQVILNLAASRGLSKKASDSATTSMVEAGAIMANDSQMVSEVIS